MTNLTFAVAFTIGFILNVMIMFELLKRMEANKKEKNENIYYLDRSKNKNKGKDKKKNKDKDNGVC